MAGDWLKFDKATPDKPEVIVMAATLRISRDEVVGKLLRVWAWADTVSIDGAAVGVPERFIDELVQKKGFAVALRAAGWLHGEDGNLNFANFDRHNGSTAKARAESNRRMVASRKNRNNGCGSVAEKAQQKAQPEKRREEKSDLVKENAPDLAAEAQQVVDLYPRREKWAEALRIVYAHLIDGDDIEAMKAGTIACADVIRRMPGGAAGTYVPSAESFFAKKRWKDDPETLFRDKGQQPSKQPSHPNGYNESTDLSHL